MADRAGRAAGLEAADGPRRSPMKTLSIRQPWAWLIVNGFKDVENRSWPTRFRGRFLIHASLAVARDYDDLVRRIKAEFHIELPPKAALQRGGIVGEAELIDCVTSCPSAWFEGQYGFALKNAKVMAFKSVKGRLNFFEVSYP
jgi:hypothetical protein